MVVSAYVGAESADPGEFVGGEAVGGASLPAEVVSGVEECKRRCGLA